MNVTHSNQTTGATDLGTNLKFDRGTLTLEGVPEGFAKRHPEIKWDSRSGLFRAPAASYRDIVLDLRSQQIAYQDNAKSFAPHAFELQASISPRDYQQAALDAWLAKGSRGVVTLPTGAGKTILAVLAIARTARPTLVHVPTLDLMHQWYEVLKTHFGVEVGLLGGGYSDFRPLTVATYDSALIHVPHKGHAFGFLVFDECHHLPGEQYKFTAISALAPFRLGLTATPERNDGKEALLYDLCGPLCFQAHIRDLEGHTLAPYEIETISVELGAIERVQYDEARSLYVNYVRKERIDFGQPGGWGRFIWKSSQTPEGRAAFKAYLKQKKLSQASEAKEDHIWDLLLRHRDERIIIFTQDNEMAYRLGRRFFLPVLTHHTKIKERELFLKAFRSGEFAVLVTSKVLNEGVDVPEASVAIVVSGSGSVREHVQRLGRILRARPGKRALLYELVSAGTGETFVNQRRRQHSAYEKLPPP